MARTTRPYWRPLLFAWTVALLVPLGAIGCGECDSPADCEQGELCVSGTCEPQFRPGVVQTVDGSLPERRVSPRIDTGVPDAGTSTRTSTGTFDGGTYDAGPLRIPDSSVDGGIPDATVLDDEGLVEIGSRRAQLGPEIVASGLFTKNGTSAYAIVSHHWALGGDGHCDVTRRQLLIGPVRGYVADSVGIRLGTLPENPQPIVLQPDGSRPGRFIPSQPLTSPLFVGVAPVEFEIRSTGAVGTLAGHQTGVMQPPPNADVYLPVPGTVFDSLGLGQIEWNVRSPPLIPRDVVIEMYDQDRKVVLECITPDDGEFTIPVSVRHMWLTHSPLPPAWLEVRYDEEIVSAVPLVGSTDVLPTRFRASSGFRYPVR